MPFEAGQGAPDGLAPVLEGLGRAVGVAEITDGELVVAESGAILEYLIDT